MHGKIIKGIAGFYYVNVPHEGVFECKARGIFRKDSLKPLIGDNVIIEPLNNENHKGNILEILERKNALIRPTVANINQVMLVFSVNQPKPNLNLLDRFLIMVEKENMKASICFNKIDMLEKEDVDFYENIYSMAGYKVYLTSAKKKIGIEELDSALNNVTTVFAGPSGVGKSSLLNLIQSEINLQTGDLSKKVERGKHTTRHAELICFKENSYVVDTPGFSSLSIDEILPEELKEYMIDFYDYEGKCRFNGCRHLSEPDCAVKQAVADKEIPQSRYDNYCLIYEELKNVRRY